MSQRNRKGSALIRDDAARKGAPGQLRLGRLASDLT
jgi:hypothetical protein